MLKLYSLNGIQPLDVPQESFSIVHHYDGMETLEFDISPKHALYNQLAEEVQIGYGDNLYLIKTINERKKVSTVSCGLNFDFLKSRIYTTFNSGTKSISGLLADHLPEDWSVDGADLITAQRTIEFEDATDYDIVMEAMETYGVVYKWHISKKLLEVINPLLIQPSGEYLSEELNLKSVSFKGSSSDFITRLYPFGKDNLTIAGVNGNKQYIDNNEYSDKVVCGVWRDERYTDAQSLRDDAIEKLKKLAWPTRSYACDVSAIDLNIKLYDIITLIDPRKKTRVDHRVVEYKEYPKAKTFNVITLSSVAEKITTKVEKLDVKYSEEIKVDREIIKTIQKDADAMSQRLEETYTKGETNAQIATVVKQSQNAFITEANKNFATKIELGGAVANVSTQYTTGTDKDTAPDSTAAWGETMPTPQDGEYIWQRTLSTYGDGTQKTSEPICLSTAAGKDGRGIASIKSLYAVSSSDSEAPSEWTETAPVMSADKPYLWSYEETTYTDEITASSSPRVIGIYGKGKDGVVYELSVTPQILSRTYEGALRTDHIAINTFYRTGDEIVSHLYAGRIVVEESADGETYTTGYTSAADEVGHDYAVTGSDTHIIRVSLYAAGSTSDFLSQQTVTIMQESVPTPLLTIRSVGGTVFHNSKGEIQLQAEGSIGGSKIMEASYQWYKDEKLLEEETEASYTAPASTIGSQPAVYRCDMTHQGQTYTASITLENKVEFTVSETAPEDPAINEVWLDKSDGGRVLKYWNGTDWILVSDYKGELEQIRDEQSQLLQEASGIILQHLADYSEKSEVAELRESILTQFAVLEGKIEMRFETAQESTVQIGDALEAFKTLTQVFMQFGADGMSIGKSDSPFKSVFTNDRLSFQQDGAEVAYISNNKLYITDAEIKGSLYLTNGDYRSRWYVDNKGNVCLQ
jgi:phage minor structural protein